MRVLTAQICLALLSILDTLLDLLAQFRAGTLPPIHDADDWSAIPADCRTPLRQCPAARRSSTPRYARADAHCEALAAASEQSTPSSRCRPRLMLVSPHPPTRSPTPGTSGIAWSRSQVPRWPIGKFEGQGVAATRAQTVTISNRSRLDPLARRDRYLAAGLDDPRQQPVSRRAFGVVGEADVSVLQLLRPKLLDRPA